MKVKDLKNFDKYFKLSKLMGSDVILKKYLNLEKNFVLPISISHGLDLGHHNIPQDIKSIEPIHWCYNQNIFNRSKKIKKALLIPHPWAIMIKLQKKKIKKNINILIIGPPSGRINDENLYDRLAKRKISKAYILIKERGNTANSKKFWKQKGYKVISSGKQDKLFYYRLFNILSRCNEVIGCTMSSAIFFASALKIKCSIITDYFYINYENEDYFKIHWNSKIAKNFLKNLLSNNTIKASKIAQDLIGLNLVDEDTVKKNLFNAISSLKSPIYSFERSDVNNFARCLLFSFFKKNILLTKSLFFILKNMFQKKIYLIKSNEIDIILNGKRKNNLKISKINYIKNKTEPGFSP